MGSAHKTPPTPGRLWSMWRHLTFVFWNTIQHQQWHALWEAENCMTIPLSRHRHLPRQNVLDKDTRMKPLCWTQRSSVVNRKGRCFKHQNCKMLHQCVSGCTPGVHLLICGFATCKILASFSSLFFFPWDFYLLPLTHPSLRRGQRPRLFIC